MIFPARNLHQLGSAMEYLPWNICHEISAIQLQENPMIFMGKSMVSGVDFPFFVNPLSHASSSPCCSHVQRPGMASSSKDPSPHPEASRCSAQHSPGPSGWTCWTWWYTNPSEKIWFPSMYAYTPYMYIYITLYISIMYNSIYIYIYNYICECVCGKIMVVFFKWDDYVEPQFQLGWWFIPNCFWKNTSHVPVSINQDHPVTFCRILISRLSFSTAKAHKKVTVSGSIPCFNRLTKKEHLNWKP